MKKLKIFSLLAVTLFAQAATANTLVFPSPYEPNLLGHDGILDEAFGMSNLQRVDDDMDRYWYVSAPEVTVTAVAKYAGFRQSFGFIDGNDDYTELLYVPYMDHQSNSFSIADSGSPFRFGLDPGGAPLFSSDPADNVYCGWFGCTKPRDHMVSWLVTDGQYAGDYVLAWEDLKSLGDRDYNDLVVRVSGVSLTAVPVPAALWLFASGVLGLVAVARRCG